MLQTVTIIFVFLAAVSTSFGQKACKPGTRCKASSRNTVSKQPETVFIEITDETRGRVVTYQKEYRIDHIPAHRREAYVEYLEDSLLYAGAGTFRIAGEPKKQKAVPVKRVPPRTNRYAGRR